MSGNKPKSVKILLLNNFILFILLHETLTCKEKENSMRDERKFFQGCLNLTSFFTGSRMRQVKC